jgi:hypothetical protein
MIPWGDDLTFADATKQFDNMDKIVKDVNEREQGITLRYSTAYEYFAQVHQAAALTSVRFPVYSGDFYPYADNADGYWTGFYSSRPLLKRTARLLEARARWASHLFVLARAKAGQVGSVPRISQVNADGRIEADKNPATSWGGGAVSALPLALTRVWTRGGRPVPHAAVLEAPGSAGGHPPPLHHGLRQGGSAQGLLQARPQRAGRGPRGGRGGPVAPRGQATGHVRRRRPARQALAQGWPSLAARGSRR